MTYCKLGIPYMGSKRKLAGRILDVIIEQNPNATVFYDLFGGGGAVSFEALTRPQFKKVVYNELNAGVVKLLEKIKLDGVTPEFYKWIDRETFNSHKMDEDWFGGLVKTCWSFGNNQKSYLFGKENEFLKKQLHNAIVDLDINALTKTSNYLGIDIPESLLKFSTINDRRLAVMSHIKKNKGHFELKQLENLQRLQQLERLERLEQFERLQQLEIINKSYEDVEIEESVSDVVIYLDPPYKNTRKYQEKINHDELEKFIVNNPYKIYVSGYEGFKGVFEVASFEHRSIVGACVNNKVVEKLFVNRR